MIPDQAANSAAPGDQAQSVSPNSSERRDRKKKSEDSDDTADKSSAGAPSVIPIPVQGQPSLLLLPFAFPSFALDHGNTAEGASRFKAEKPLALVNDAPSAPQDSAAQPQNDGKGAVVEVLPDLAFSARITPEAQPTAKPEDSNSQPIDSNSQKVASPSPRQDLQPDLAGHPDPSPLPETHPSVKMHPSDVESQDQEKDKSAAGETSLPLGSHSDASLVTAMSQPPANASPANKPEPSTRTAAPASKSVSEISEPPATPRADPPRGISLRLDSPGAARVDVQVVERSGKVQVAVRSTDGDLSSSLRQNLGDLVSNLENKGFKTETWAPADRLSVASTDAGNDVGNRNSSHSDGFGNRPDHGGGRDGGGHRQQQQRRPFWEYQLENSLDA